MPTFNHFFEYVMIAPMDPDPNPSTPTQPERLLARLEAIGQSLAGSGRGLALIGLGSVGLELERLDAYSDLDFFAIVEPGSKPEYLADLGWLAAPAPIVYAFRNTVDGYKYLYQDGIFCEMAVFEPDELAAIRFAPGRIVWQRADAGPNLARPQLEPASGQEQPVDWLLGEALTNLYVGLQRELRGERLSAMRFIQGYALDRLVALAGRLPEPVDNPEDYPPDNPEDYPPDNPENYPPDPFTPERRFERRYPALASRLPDFAQGYQANRASARAILAFLDERFELNPAIKQAILELCRA